jgi:hypothetical protein
MHTVKRILAIALLLPALAPADDKQWRFRVWLDDKAVGYHEFMLSERDGALLLQSEANFEYRLMFVKLYEYLHEATETWQDGCLHAIESETDANGKPYRVRGARVEDRFVLTSNVGEQDGQAEYPPCVMSFAYWNPEFLKQERLLNAQNGKLLEVQVSAPEADELEVRGEQRAAWRYRLETGELDINLWYGENDEWLALETEARGGRTLRYELL